MYLLDTKLPPTALGRNRGGSRIAGFLHGEQEAVLDDAGGGEGLLNERLS